MESTACLITDPPSLINSITSLIDKLYIHVTTQDSTIPTKLPHSPTSMLICIPLCECSYLVSYGLSLKASPSDYGSWTVILVMKCLFDDLLFKKTNEANSVSFFNSDIYFWFIIIGTIVFIWWLSNTWWFSRLLDDIWVSRIYKSHTTPTILHNEECYPLNHDMLDYCARGGLIGTWHVVVRWRPTCIVGIL